VTDKRYYELLIVTENVYEDAVSTN